jgi:hypothetical protein
VGALSSYLPFTNWKQAAGLFVVVVIFVAVAVKFGVQSKVNKIVGT